MIIGVHGRIGSGKDTFVSAVQEVYPDKEIVVLKFADVLKDVAELILGIPRIRFEDQAFKNTFLPAQWDTISPNGTRVRMTVRTFLQKLGTDAIRNGLHSETWVNATIAKITNADAIYVITDLRFPNEFYALKALNAKLIHINRWYYRVPLIKKYYHPYAYTLEYHVNALVPEDEFLKERHSDLVPNDAWHTANHISETALNEVSRWDAVIDNDDTVDKYFHKCKDVVSQLIKS
jgi:hypothetical protein